jgi:rhodanese-related sulfurtransferase
LIHQTARIGGPLLSAARGRCIDSLQGFEKSEMTIRTISPQELAAQNERGEVCELLDVRTPVEFREVHVSFARNVPLDRFDAPALLSSRNGASQQPLYVICRSGNRGNQACEKLVAAGFKNVINVAGGTLAWEQAGLPVTRGQKGISLERQVRIAIGLIVLTGSALTWFHDPRWIGLPAFMGAGLIFSGIADFCGLALILGRMPWNQVAAPIRETQSSPGACCSITKPGG